MSLTYIYILNDIAVSLWGLSGNDRDRLEVRIFTRLSKLSREAS